MSAEVNLRGVRVLVVEDDDSARDLFMTILTWCGASVLVAASVAEAISVLTTERVAAIVSDISMPFEDGYALMRRLNEMGLTIPSVALTAHRYEHTPDRTLRAGFQRHLIKPVEPRVLCDTVAELVL